MSTSDVPVSPEEHDEPADASVFDFLYHDSRRVGSFLAQLDQNGLLKEIKQTDKVTKDGKRGFSLTLGGNAPLIGGGTVGLQRTPKESGAETLERVYDPFWANARELLDGLEANGLIGRDLINARIGSVVLVSGTMTILDLGMVQALWALPSIQRAVHAGAQDEADVPANRQGRRANARNQPPPVPINNDAQTLLEVLPTLPHSVNVTIASEDGTTWGGLKEEYFVGTGSDLVLKHGLTIPGEWHMLGVLDAQPDLGSVEDADGDDPAYILFNSVVGQIAKLLSPIIRVMLGRPPTSFGVTPLLIFRDVSSYIKVDSE